MPYEVKGSVKSTTELFKQIMQHPGKYVCKEHFRFSHSTVYDKYEFERRYVEAYKEEHVQILRYLAKSTYADLYSLVACAEQFRKSGKMATVITDVDYIEKMTKTLVRYGAVCERAYIDPENVSKDGEQLSSKNEMRVYCLTEMGASLFKRKTEYTDYIEEYLWEAGSLDIMRRLSTNNIIINTRAKFSGYSDLCGTYRIPGAGLKRQVVYGKMENSSDLVIYEPVFYRREETVQTEKDLLDHYKERTQFLTRYFSDVGKNKRKTLVIVVEVYEHIRDALSQMKDVMDVVDEVYVTSELLVANTTFASNALPYAPFLRIVKTEDKINVKQSTPSAFAKLN